MPSIDKDYFDEVSENLLTLYSIKSLSMLTDHRSIEKCHQNTLSRNHLKLDKNYNRVQAENKVL